MTIGSLEARGPTDLMAHSTLTSSNAATITVRLLVPAGPGTAIQNLLPPVLDPAANGPYSLCAKCHDLSNILSDASFRKHSVHINAGFSCSVCHTTHGVANSSGGLSGERLVSFDLNVVARNDASQAPIAYNRSTGTCTLKCHNQDHNQNGTISGPRSVRH